MRRDDTAAPGAPPAAGAEAAGAAADLLASSPVGPALDAEAPPGPPPEDEPSDAGPLAGAGWRCCGGAWPPRRSCAAASC